MDYSIGGIHRLTTSPSAGIKVRPTRSHVSAQIVAPAMRICDLASFLLGGLIASLCLNTRGEPGLLGGTGQATMTGPEFLATLIAGATTLLVLERFGAYRPHQIRLLGRRILTRGAATLTGMAAAVLCLMLIPDHQSLSQVWPLAWGAVVLLSIMLGHALLGVAVRHWGAAGRLSRRVVVVGVNEISLKVLEGVGKDGDGEHHIVGLYSDAENPALATHAGYNVQGGLHDIVSRSMVERIDAVVLAMPLTETDRIARARSALNNLVGDLYVTACVPGLSLSIGGAEKVGALPVVNIRPCPLMPWQTLQKAVFDQVLSVLLLLALSPVLAFVALLIKLDSPGPVFFRQPRLGFNNLMFTVFKFRTMRHDRADLLADVQTTRGDPRITRVGRVLRKFSLDELPQLLNVADGSMSLIGPRPHAPNTKVGDVLFHDAVAAYALRHRVKPGITGWAQANGWRGETRTLEQIEQRVAHDLYYIDNWSLKLDLKILWMTVRREIFSRTAF